MAAVTGFSEHIDSYTAGQEAAKAIQAGMARPDMLLCFVSVHHDQAEVLQGIRSVLVGTPLLGGSSGATVTEAGWRKRAVALLGFQSDTIRLARATAANSHEDSFRAGREAAESIRQQFGRQPRMLLIFPQAVVGCDHPEFLAGLQAVLPQTYIAGGASAMDGMLDPSHPLFLKSFQYWDEAVCEHTTPVLGLDWEAGTVSDAFAWDHGFVPTGKEAVVSRAEGGLVYEIDGLPAPDFFKQFLGEDFDFRVDAAQAVLGLPETYGRDVTALRVSPALGLAPDGAIQYIVPLATGQSVKLMRYTRTELIEAARRTAETLQARLGGRRPTVIFSFSCGGRHALLGDRCAEEVEQIKAVFGADVPIIGLQAGGEFVPIAPGRSEADDHPGLYGQWQNYSLCLYALAE